MPQKSTTKFKELGLAFSLGLVGGFLLLRHKAAPKKLPYLKIWQKLQQGQRSGAEIRRIAGLMQANYESLYAQRAKVQHPALQFHQERNILAALAIYQVLLKEGVKQADALDQIEGVFRQAMLPLLKIYALQKYLPDAFDVMRRSATSSMKYIFPEIGFKSDWLENSPERIAVNIHGCFYLETFKAQGAPELTAIFCKLDDILFEQLPSSISWERTTTLGRGGDMCNFQWSKVDVTGKKALNVIQP
jgi:hypothetical protein